MVPVSHAGIPADGEPSLSTSCTAADIEKQHSPTQDTVLKENAPDLNIVNWDGDHDPEKPVNWSGKKKWANGGLLAAMTFLT